MKTNLTENKDEFLQDFSLENNFSKNQKEHGVTPKFT